MLASGLWVAGGRPCTELMFYSVAGWCHGPALAGRACECPSEKLWLMTSTGKGAVLRENPRFLVGKGGWSIGICKYRWQLKGASPHVSIPNGLIHISQRQKHSPLGGS